jgi:hypothetical protein
LYSFAGLVLRQAIAWPSLPGQVGLGATRLAGIAVGWRVPTFILDAFGDAPHHAFAPCRRGSDGQEQDGEAQAGKDKAKLNFSKVAQ